MPLTCWSLCYVITALCSIRFDRHPAIFAKSVTHCWLLKEFSCSEDWVSSRSRRTSRNPSCATRAISLWRCWPNNERARLTVLEQNDNLVPDSLDHETDPKRNQREFPVAKCRRGGTHHPRAQVPLRLIGAREQHRS